MAAAAHGTGQVGLDDRVPVLVRHTHDQRIAGNPGVVHQDVDAAEPSHRVCDDALHIGIGSNVAPNGENIRGPPDLLHQ